MLRLQDQLPRVQEGESQDLGGRLVGMECVNWRCGACVVDAAFDKVQNQPRTPLG